MKKGKIQKDFFIGFLREKILKKEQLKSSIFTLKCAFENFFMFHIKGLQKKKLYKIRWNQFHVELKCSKKLKILFAFH